jgi:predicted metal-binding protein
MRLIRILGAGAFAVALAQTPKPAPKRELREVRATGCIRIAQNGCVVLKTLDGNTTYTFQAAPKPEAGAVVTIQGTAHAGTSPCKQGIVLDVTDWEPTGEMCVE